MEPIRIPKERNMQVVILCGGQGTRIRDVADDIPKPMIPIGERPILWHIMKGYAHHGFTDFILCLGHKSSVIKRYFLDYHVMNSDCTLNLARPDNLRIHSDTQIDNWQVTLAETGLDAMTGCRIKRIEKYICGDSFMGTYGDGVSDIDISALARYHRAHGKTATVTAVRPPGRFGEVELDAGNGVREFAEKPNVSGGWISGGFFVFNRAIFDYLSDDPELVLERSPMSGLVRDGQLQGWKHEGFWHPMDNSRDYRWLNDMWNNGTAPWQTWNPDLKRRAA
jgi:glucose-1-phosphate cytidylyltransferase